VDSVAPLKVWGAFQRLGFATRAVAWFAAALVVAIVGLASETDPVNDSKARLDSYLRVHPQASATPRTGPPPSGKVEGKDAQLPAGATPSEIARAKLPAGFKADEAGLRQLFAATIGGRGRTGQKQNILRSVQCSGGNCRLTYVPDGPGRGRIMETQGVLWAGLATDPDWRSATITAVPGKRRKGADGRPFSISCTRSDLKAIGEWGVQSTPRIRRFCQVGA
jgi:hypothetical protein